MRDLQVRPDALLNLLTMTATSGATKPWEGEKTSGPA